jgi:hypothetical protein
MTSEPTSEDMIYANMVLKIFSICKEDKVDRKLVVFEVERKDTGFKAYVLGHISDLNDKGEVTEYSKFFMLAEFLPDRPTEEIYEVKNYFIPAIVKSPPPIPLPDNVFQFRKK